MRLEFVSNGFQLVASIAVIVGLLLVVQELRQAKQLTGAEPISTNYVAFTARETALLGEQPAGAIVRSCMDRG